MFSWRHEKLSGIEHSLNQRAAYAVQKRHYSFALIHAKSKTRVSTGKQRNIAGKGLLGAELFYSSLGAQEN